MYKQNYKTKAKYLVCIYSKNRIVTPPISQVNYLYDLYSKTLSISLQY